MSFEDGTMRTISLVKAANDLPFSGKSYTGKKQPGLHSSTYSSFAIWSVQVSRITGTFWGAHFCDVLTISLLNVHTYKNV